MLANSLTNGCDCFGEIHYFDAVLTDSRGNVSITENAICLHEEDYGILWKHTDWRTEHVDVRRSRRLVISFITTVDNYGKCSSKIDPSNTYSSAQILTFLTNRVRLLLVLLSGWLDPV